jgi:carbonic anhydrase/acetyltransferase-like protein (isoleucine patch superfamily)
VGVEKVETQKAVSPFDFAQGETAFWVASLIAPISLVSANITKNQVTEMSLWPAPDLTAAAFVAPNATVMGRVELQEGASIWYSVVLRGDVEQIVVGKCTNVQDGAVLHGDPGKPTVLEDYVTVGHRAVVHSAWVERGSLIGIGAIILDGVRVGAGSIIGAGSVVTKDVPARSLVMGVPGKVIREVSEAEAAGLLEHAERYRKLALAHAGKGSETGFECESPTPDK